MPRFVWMVALLAFADTAPAADLSKVERRIVKEPVYKTRSPRYALLVFGPEACDRVWLVKDGGTLYVDRNGDGDLTGAGEKVAAKEGGSADAGYTFAVGDLNVGGKKHSLLDVTLSPVKGSKAESLRISLCVTAPHLKVEGQVVVVAGPGDHNGTLMMAAKASDAPIIHCGGPLAVTFDQGAPTLRRDQWTECIAFVGSPGLGAGTFAMIAYDDWIPGSVHPSLEITYPVLKEGTPPVRQRYELKKRC